MYNALDYNEEPKPGSRLRVPVAMDNPALQSGAVDEDQPSEPILLTTEQDDAAVAAGLTKEEKRIIIEKDKHAPFSSFQIIDGTVRLPSRWGLSKIPKVEPVDINAPANSVTFRIGDTIYESYAQSVECWEILDIEDTRVKVSYWGWMRGVGDFDETYWVKESAEP